MSLKMSYEFGKKLLNVPTFTLTHTISLTGVRSGAELYNGRTLYVLELPSAGSWDFYSTSKALSLCFSGSSGSSERCSGGHL